MAVSWSVVPFAMLAPVGERLMPTSVAAETVSVALPVTAPMDALIVVWPCASPVARPTLAAALDTVAKAGLLESQTAWAVRSCVVPSENVPVAVNCWVVPLAIDGAAGETAMALSVAPLTVSEVWPVTAPTEAEIVVSPVASAEASPRAPLALETAATLDAELAHETTEVMSCVLPSE